MPFATEFDPVYTDGIKSGVERAAVELGYAISVQRADELHAPSMITRDIIEFLCRSACCVADLTGSNPNVFYELGVVHAVGDKTVMICQDHSALPFDLKAYRVVGYTPDAVGLSRLSEEVCAAIIGILRRAPGAAPPRSNPVSDFAPVRLADVTLRLPEVLALERQATGEIWILGPDVDIDIRDYVEVMREAMIERSVVYKYILPDVPHADRSWQRMLRELDLPDGARDRLRRKMVPEHVIESELVIYNPGVRGEAVFLIPSAEDSENIYVRLPPTRGAAVRRRFERLWSD